MKTTNQLRFRVAILFMLLVALTTLVGTALAQDGSGGEQPGIIIPPDDDAKLTIKKVVVGAVPANDWVFGGSFSFTIPAAGGEATFFPGAGTYTITETAVSGYTTKVSCDSGESGGKSVTVTLSTNEVVICTFTNTGSAPPVSNASLYVSPATAGTVGGVAATPQDILYRNGTAGTWAMYFDGSDVGVTKPIAAFARLADGSLLLALKAGQSLPNGVGAVTSWDVVRFVPTSTGNSTAGTFSWYIDGSDVGLTTTGEKIDALDVLTNGRVVVSTTGGLSVPKQGGGTLSGQDEDAIAFVPTQLGATTTGSWVAYFDGTAIPGMGVEDLTGIAVDEATGNRYITILGAYTVGGVSGNGKEVLKLAPSGAPGGYTVSQLWQGPANGFNLVPSGVELP